MPALNFQPRFAPLVESGEKRQTIRAYRKDGRDPKPGDTLYLYTGQRTKKARRIGVVECASVHAVKIFRKGAVVEGDEGDVVYDEHHDAREAFAGADGFEDWESMREWFEKHHGLPFRGLVIRW